MMFRFIKDLTLICFIVFCIFSLLFVGSNSVHIIFLIGKKKQLPKNMKRPTQTKQDVNNYNSSSDNSSGSDDEIIHRSTTDYDPYNPFP